MPFGLNLKSIIVGALLAYFVLPRILAFVTNIRSGGSSDNS